MRPTDRYIRLTSAAGPSPTDPQVSADALILHLASTVFSARYGTPGFVPDQVLSRIAQDTTTQVLELCTAGLWRREPGGYRILDDDLVDLATQT